MNQKQYCQEHGIKVSTLYYYRKKLKQENNQFVELPQFEMDSNSIKIRFESKDIYIDVPLLFCEDTLKKLLKCLEV